MGLGDIQWRRWRESTIGKSFSYSEKLATFADTDVHRGFRDSRMPPKGGSRISSFRRYLPRVESARAQW